MFIPFAVGQLDQAQPVAAGDKTHGFGIDGDGTLCESHLGGEIFLVQVDCHSHS
jgi:hypothetical protein